MTNSIFWTKWAAIGQVLGAFGTFAAVAVSLHLARRSEKPKLLLTCGIRLIIDPMQAHGESRPQVIDITVRNQGLITAHVSQYGWETSRSPFKWPTWASKQFAIQMPGLTGLGKDPPVEVKPGTRQSTILDFQNFKDGIMGKSGKPLFARKWPIFGLRSTAVYIVAHLESGLSIKHRVESDLEKELYEIEFDRTRQAGSFKSNL